MNKKRKKFILIKKGLKKISKKEILSSSFHNFDFDLRIIKELNKILPKSLNKFFTLEREKSLKKIGKFNKKDVREYQRFQKWTEKSLDKQKQFSTTSTKVAKFVGGKTYEFVHSHRYNLFIREMSLIYLITSFEEFLEHIISNVYSIKPVALKQSGKQLSFNEIISTKDRDELFEKMIFSEVKTLLKNDIYEINEYLVNRFKLDLSKKNNWKQFKERFYRRHILIHNNLRPDEQYRMKTGYRGTDTRLDVSQQYLNRSLSLYKNYAKYINDFFISKYS